MDTLNPLSRKRQEQVADAIARLNASSGAKVWTSPRLSESVKQRTNDLLLKR